MTEQAPREVLTPLGVGTETEYSHLIKRDYDSRMRTPEQGMAGVVLRACTPDYIDRTGYNQLAREYGSDGARRYEDCGHPEDSRPVSKTIRGAIAQELGGQETMVDIYTLATVTRAPYLRPFFDDFRLSLRLVGSDGATWGKHLNFLMRREAIREHAGTRQIDWERFQLLAARLATAPYADGAGGFYLGDFHHAQKTATLGVDFTSRTQSRDSHRESKPLVNTRDKTLADEQKYFRLHVVSHDALINPKAEFRLIGSTMLTAMAIQEGTTLDPEMEPHDPYWNVARMVADDLTMQRKIRLANGREVHPLDLEESVIDSVGVLEGYLDPELAHALEMWRDAHQRMRTVQAAGKNKTGIAAIEAVHTAAVEHLTDVVWALKLKHMHQDYAENAAKYKNIRTYADLLQSTRWAGVDGVYDRFDSDVSFGLQDRFLPEYAPYMPSRQEIEDAKTGAGLTARAAQISRFISLHPNSADMIVGWYYVEDMKRRRFNLLEPFETNQELEEYLLTHERAQAYGRLL